jgi:hypothetical protein
MEDLPFTQSGVDGKPVESLKMPENPRWVKAMEQIDPWNKGTMRIPWLRSNVSEKIGVGIRIRTQDPTEPARIRDNWKRFAWNLTLTEGIGYVSKNEKLVVCKTCFFSLKR